MTIDSELRDICTSIVAEGLLENEWAMRESDDMFSTINYVGGFDATEMAFCFAKTVDKRELTWFQFSLEEARAIADGSQTEIEDRPAEI